MGKIPINPIRPIVPIPNELEDVEAMATAARCAEISGFGFRVSGMRYEVWGMGYGIRTLKPKPETLPQVGRATHEAGIIHQYLARDAFFKDVPMTTFCGGSSR